MCLDCGVGSCLSENSTVCVCPSSYSQSTELYRLPAEFVCNFTDPNVCLPCNVNDDALFALYLSTALLDVLVLAVFLQSKPDFKRIKRWIFFVSCFTLSAVACILRTVDNTRLYGEDPVFTLIFTYSLTCGVVFVLLITERFIRYIINSLRIYKTQTRKRSLLLAIIYSNWFITVCLFGIGTIPMIAALEPDRNVKMDLIAAGFLASGLVLLYVEVVHNIIYCRLLNDLDRLIEGNATQQRKSVNLGKYKRAKKRIRLQRVVLNALFGPGVLVYSLSFFIDELFESLKYILPVTSLIGALLLLILVAGLRSFKRSAHSSDQTKKNPHDMSFTRLVTV